MDGQVTILQIINNVISNEATLLQVQAQREKSILGKTIICAKLEQLATLTQDIQTRIEATELLHQIDQEGEGWKD